MSDIKFIIIFNISILVLVNAVLVQELHHLFDKNPCIEASLITVSSSQEASVMIDKSSKTQSTTLINITELTKPNFEKSAQSRINELAQYNEIQYSYELISEEGPPHNKNYEIILKLGDEQYEGSGTSLKKAQKAAAMLALENTFYEHPPVKLEPEKENSLTPTVVLNNVAMKLGFAVSYSLITDKDEQVAITSYGAYDESYGKSKSYYTKINSSATFRVPTEEPQITGPFTVKVKVGDSVFTGSGHTIQAARHDAATNAIKNLEKEILYKNNVCANEETLEECKQKKEELKSPVTRVYERAQKSNLPVEFTLIDESGKSHQKNFVTRCKLGEFMTEAEGSSKKESKRRAAEKMLENFPLLPELADGKEIINGLKSKKKKKKKKNKVIKKNVQNLGHSISDMLTAFWSTNDEQSIEKNDKTNYKSGKDTKKHNHKTDASPKDKLLELSNKINIQVQFSDLNKYQDNFYSLMSLGINPLHVCLGKAVTRDKSHDAAALHGLKFLHKAGILDKPLTDEKEHIMYYINDEYLRSDHDVSAPLEEIDEK